MQLTEKEKNDLIAVGFFAVLVLGGLAYFWIMFGKDMVAKKTTQADTEYQKLEITWSKMDQLDIIAEETAGDKYDELVARIAEINKLLPTSSQPITFFAALDGALRETNIQPPRPDPRCSAAAPSTRNPLLDRRQRRLRQLPASSSTKSSATPTVSCASRLSRSPTNLERPRFTS
jgi:hypothetical protein